ncbi:hypothetical protein HCN44_009165 [Aphidius gifuensis]|uniref:Uncharacterized protein n=1 Tax=Aphidius gifuensis TaxID=684658 RepID=A0A834Y4P1_APHGI|nr:hypothetical protein HCN44_009165 [Aphidius gifuensis]
MMDSNISRPELFGMIAKMVLVSFVGFYSMKYIMNQIDPMSKAKKAAREKANRQLRKVKNGNNISLSINESELTDYEMMIASHLIDPKDIPVTWDNIAGLDNVVQELKETVILPIRRKELFEDSMCTMDQGSKTTAKESGTCFINLDVSISGYMLLLNYSLVLYSLMKLVNINTYSFLRARTSNDHEATAMMKAQFMSLWDGLITDPGCTVIIMGATNRPQDLDRAILRRMPATFRIGLPNEDQRTQVLGLILEKEPTADVDVKQLSKLTDGFSGSDLHELCRTASLYRVRDYSREHPCVSPNRNEVSDEFHDALRPITHDDLLSALKKMKISKVQTSTNKHAFFSGDETKDDLD